MGKRKSRKVVKVTTASDTDGVRSKKRKTVDLKDDSHCQESLEGEFGQQQKMSELWNRRPTNPFLIDPVMEKVFQHLFHPRNLDSDENMKSIFQVARSCRLVCKLWRELATPAYRKVAEPTQFGSLSVDNSGRRSLPDAALKRFMKEMKIGPTFEMIPTSVHRFIIEESICVENSSSKKLFSEFMEKHSPQIVELTFKAENFNNLYCPVTDLLNFNMENLKILRIFCNGFSKPERNKPSNHDFFPFVEALLERSPNLEEFAFRLRDEGFWERADATRIGEMFKRIPASVTRLDLQTRLLCASHYDILLERKLQLEKLALSNGVMSAIPAISLIIRLRWGPFKFLDQQKRTLKSLRMERVYNSAPQMTNLEHLRIVDSGKRGVWGYLSAIAPIPDSPLPKWMMSNVEKCFPNLKSIQLDGFHYSKCFELMVRAVFENFVGVQELSIVVNLRYQSSHLMASMLSGISTYDYNRIHSNGVPLNLHRSPNVLNLTRLKKLKIVNTCPVEGNSEFTVYADTLIFSKMDSLEELTVEGFKMPDLVQKLLGSKLNKFNFSRTPQRKARNVFFQLS